MLHYTTILAVYTVDFHLDLLHLLVWYGLLYFSGDNEEAEEEEEVCSNSQR